MKHFGLLLTINNGLLQNQLNEIRDYSTAVEGLLAREASTVGQELDDAARKLPEDERPDFYADNAEYFQYLDTHFPNRHRLSLISMAYSVFEDYLVATCRMLKKQKNLELGLRDLSGNSQTNKAKKYLSKVLNVPLDEQSWRTMEAYASIRNVIVHGNGHCTAENRKPVADFATEHPELLTLDHLDGIIASDKLLPAYLASIRDFYAVLFSALGTWGGVRGVAP